MASPTIKRIDLPSGEWWEIETRPHWKHVREWALGRAIRRSGATGAPYGEPDLIERTLVSLTTRWSFEDPVCLDSLPRRGAGDVLAVMVCLEDKLGPLWNGRPVKALAEKLFDGLAMGQLPREFAEVHIMALTGWSWQTLQETPADVVERMAIYAAVKGARDAGGAVVFPDGSRESNVTQCVWL